MRSRTRGTAGSSNDRRATFGRPCPDRHVELVKYARKKGFYQIELISNGYLWNEAMVHSLNDAGLDRLQVSVDGVTPNDVTIKVLKPLRKKLEVIAKHAKFRVTLNGVIGSAPAGEALQVVEFAKSNGVRARVQLVHDGHGQLALTPEQAQEYADVKRAIGKRFGHCKTRSGFSGIQDVGSANPLKDDAMQSFFLSETLK
jgi:MoaA/NifB/PqqE/SkfB family radical SAM enzyme